MRLTTLILLLIFTLAQSIPALKYLCSNAQVALFIPDEETSTEEVKNSTQELKEKKDEPKNYIFFILLSCNNQHLAKGDNTDRLPKPILDKNTPPPNIC